MIGRTSFDITIYNKLPLIYYTRINKLTVLSLYGTIMLHHGGKITLIIKVNEFQLNIKQPYSSCHIEFVKY